MDTNIVSQVPAADERMNREALTAPGRRIGRVVIEGQNGLGYVVCHCDCGETVAAATGKVIAGEVYCCASCSSYEARTPAHRLIGRDYKALVRRGSNARQRCENPRNPNYQQYGGRGIGFGFNSVEEYALCVHIHGYLKGLDKQVDRIDNDGDYCPSNIRLSTRRDNVNNRRNTFLVDGIPLSEIVRKFGGERRSTHYAVRDAILRRVAETERPPSMDFVVAKIRELSGRAPRTNPHRNKRQPVLVDGISLTSFLNSLASGLGANRIAYDRCKNMIRSRNSRGLATSASDIMKYISEKMPDSLAA